LVLVACDLAHDDLASVLATRIDRAAPTLVVAEGVLMYLPPERVATLAHDLRGAIDGRVQAIATAISSDIHRRPRLHRDRPWVAWWLRAVGEPFRWGIERCELAAAISAQRFELVELARD